MKNYNEWFIESTKRIETRVAYIMEFENPEAIIDSWELYKSYLMLYRPDVLHVDRKTNTCYIDIRDLFTNNNDNSEEGLPSFESISRARRKVLSANPTVFNRLYTMDRDFDRFYKANMYRKYYKKEKSRFTDKIGKLLKESDNEN